MVFMEQCHEVGNSLPTICHEVRTVGPNTTADTFMRHFKMLLPLCDHVMVLLASVYMKAQADPAKWCPYTA